MVTTILIIIFCAVFSLVIGLHYGDCLNARMYAKEYSKLWMGNTKVWTINDYQCEQIDELIHAAEDQNEVLNKLVNILDSLKLKLETEYLTKK